MNKRSTYNDDGYHIEKFEVDYNWNLPDGPKTVSFTAVLKNGTILYGNNLEGDFGIKLPKTKRSRPKPFIRFEKPEDMI